MNLLELVQTDGFTLKKIATTNGGEYSGACPFCGGSDRFRVWPSYKGGKWWCRKCGKEGDVIDYLRDYRSMNYHDARELVGSKHDGLAALCPSGRPGQGKNSPSIPSSAWQNQAAKFISLAEQNLLSIPDSQDDISFDGFVDNDGRMVFSSLQFLLNRGLSLETIINNNLGWIGYQTQESRLTWGLPTKERRKLIIPSGLFIPTYNSQGELIRIRIRRKFLYKGNQYHIITGSSLAPMILSLTGRHAQACIVVESELDGLLLHQEASDLVTVIALGSASIRPNIATDTILQQADIILLALDNDEAGAKASWSFWIPTYGKKVKRWPVPIGKDPGEALQMGVNIRAWIEAGLMDYSTTATKAAESVMEATSTYETMEGVDNVFPFPLEWVNQLSESQLERLAVMTVDGGLTDAEALKAMQAQ